MYVLRCVIMFAISCFKQAVDVTKYAHTHTHSKVRKIFSVYFSVYPTESCDRRTREESTGKMTRDYRDSSKVKVLASS